VAEPVHLTSVCGVIFDLTAHRLLPANTASSSSATDIIKQASKLRDKCGLMQECDWQWWSIRLRLHHAVSPDILSHFLEPLTLERSCSSDHTKQLTHTSSELGKLVDPGMYLDIPTQSDFKTARINHLRCLPQTWRCNSLYYNPS